MNQIKTTLASLLVLLPFAADAVLIDAGVTTIDTSSGLEWLDVTETVGLSYDTVLASSFVTVDGYRYATEDEVNALYTNAGWDGSTAPLLSSTAANFAPASLLIDLLGCTSDVLSAVIYPCGGDGEHWHTAMWGPSDFNVAIVDINFPNAGLGSLLPTWFANPGSSNTPWRVDVGSYLVRDVTQVPEPGTLALLGIGLAALGLSRRRKV